jgi:hypothetical protein
LTTQIHIAQIQQFFGRAVAQTRTTNDACWPKGRTKSSTTNGTACFNKRRCDWTYNVPIYLLPSS